MAAKGNVTIKKVFEQLNENVRYFHFKSNQHIDKSFIGKTDFDLIIHPDDYTKFENILLDFDFKRRVNTFNKFYFGMEDYLYYDADSEQLHHFHVHYDLIFGKKYSKNYHFPNLKFWLNNTILHPEYPIRIVIPELELMLLTLRIIIKNSDLQNIKILLKKVLKRKRYPKRYIYEEYKYLLQEIDNNKFEILLKENFRDIEDYIINFKQNFISNKLDILYLHQLKRKLIKNIKVYQRVDYRTNKKLKKLRMMSKAFSASVLPNNGKVISLIGVDGSGKTTLSNDITNWLSYKLSVRNIFLGQVKKSNTNYVLRKIAKVLRILKFSYFASIVKDYTHIINAKYRMTGINNCFSLAQRGHYIITDRYPLKEFWDMDIPMDGPKLKEESIFHRKERQFYNSFPKYPDVIIILKIPIEVSIKRKPDEHNNDKIIGNLKKKIEAIEKLNSVANLYEIDATLPYNVVFKKVKEIIWSKL